MDIGVVKLQKGASLVAWLDPDFARKVAVPVRALLRYEAAPASSATAVRLAVPVAEGVFTKKGVIQLAPLAPGRYVLEAQAKGYAPARLPVQLYEGRVTTPRRSLELSPALNVRFLLQPPLGPGGIPWHVELWRKTDSGSGSQDAGSGTASQDGIFEAPEQAEGPLHVYLKDSKQNILASRDVLITTAMSEYPLQVDVNTVKGMVTIDDLAVPSARLLFGGSGGAEKIHATTDRDGHFTVVLPRLGTWIVDVDAAEESIAATTEVVIEREEVEIALPGTEVSGWVRDADAQRVPGARVLLFAGAGAMQRTTDKEGNFRFRGVRAGTVQLRANDPKTRDSSGEISVTVPEAGKIANVEMTLESVRSLQGIVRSNGDVVVGALVHGWAFSGGSAQQKETTTDLGGRFALDVPQSVAEAVIIVGAPGRTLESFSVPADREPINLELAPRGGTLVLRWSSGSLPLRFAFNDHFMASPDMFLWARGQGARVEDGVAEIPNIAPGKYQFCSARGCAEGLLSIGGQLELDATGK